MWPDFPLPVISFYVNELYQLLIIISSVRISLHSFFYFKKLSTWNWRLPFAVNVNSAIIRYQTINNISEGKASLLLGLNIEW